jgi:hypothetical protein
VVMGLIFYSPQASLGTPLIPSIRSDANPKGSQGFDPKREILLRTNSANSLLLRSTPLTDTFPRCFCSRFALPQSCSLYFISFRYSLTSVTPPLRLLRPSSPRTTGTPVV